ncbi:MAG: cyclic 2,3-diphosphoglycerate synthase [Dehalococcoidales bacterium]|nr:cyclic 2,3-diphosphoglycerate synthase [Dehalococcoidales bacterium]
MMDRLGAEGTPLSGSSRREGGGPSVPQRRRVVIMGAGGRDFHNFNVYFRNNRTYEVVAFTATQIPGIADRRYPAELAGDLYPRGIPIYEEAALADVIRDEKVDEVVFAYSDVSHSYVMGRASAVLATGANFWLLGPDATMLQSSLPVVAVVAVRTGSGKSQTSRRVTGVLKGMGLRVVVVRHPMAYGDLAAMAVQRYASEADLQRYSPTIEEREEYEPHVVRGTVVYAGVDYERILRQAEREADVIVWDGGNNDFSFYRPDVNIVVADPLRAGHEVQYYPGETNLRMADVVVINKVDTAEPEQVQEVRLSIAGLNPKATVIEAASPFEIDKPELVRGKRVLVIEDGPTLTHGGMAYGAGVLAARAAGATELIDPRPAAVGSIAETFNRYPHVGSLLPAMGYGSQQTHDLEETIRRADPEVVVVATPVDLRRILHIDQPMVRVEYGLAERSHPDLQEILEARIKDLRSRRRKMA